MLRTAASAPHALLLPLCCAVVHHGGAGTTAAALAAGTPQLVCPVHFDQFAWVSASPLPPGVDLISELKFCTTVLWHFRAQSSVSGVSS